MNGLLLKLSRWAMLAFLLSSMLEVGLSLTFQQVYSRESQSLLTSVPTRKSAIENPVTSHAGGCL
jgi:hypothetical protein